MNPAIFTVANILLYYWLAFFFEITAVVVGFLFMWKFGLFHGGDNPFKAKADAELDTLDEQRKKMDKWRQ